MNEAPEVTMSTALSLITVTAFVAGLPTSTGPKSMNVGVTRAVAITACPRTSTVI